MSGRMQEKFRAGMWGVALGKMVLFKPNLEGGGRTGWGVQTGAGSNTVEGARSMWRSARWTIWGQEWKEVKVQRALSYAK